MSMISDQKLNKNTSLWSSYPQKRTELDVLVRGHYVKAVSLEPTPHMYLILSFVCKKYGTVSLLYKDTPETDEVN